MAALRSTMPGEFTTTTKDELKQLNAFRCANPDCRHYTLGAKITGGLYTTGEAAHIYGKAPGAARYNAAQTDNERSALANAIWLCSRCHSMVDPDANRFPVALLLKWKDMSENLHNYSAPTIAFARKSFFYGRSPWPPQQSALGGHLIVGPSNLEGICSDCWIEGLDSAGRFRLEIDRYYQNDESQGGKRPHALDDWYPFLTKEGMEGLVYFSGRVPTYRQYLAYRIALSYQIMGQDFAFHSLWQLGKLTRVQEETFQLDRKAAPLLEPIIDWLFARAETDDARRIFAIFSHPVIHLRHYTWTTALHVNPVAQHAWRNDGQGVSVCFGEIPNGTTFGFIHQTLKVGLVVSTAGVPVDNLIATDGPTELIQIT